MSAYPLSDGLRIRRSSLAFSVKLNIYIDGASRGNPGPASTGVVLQDTDGNTVKEFGRTLGVETNNVAEYSALIDALRLSKEAGATALKVHSDSQLLVRQVNGQYKIKNPRLGEFIRNIRAMVLEFESFEIVHVRREFNKRADALANEALDREFS